MKNKEIVELQRRKYVGKVFPTKNYGNLKITKYTNNSNIEVLFIDTGYVTTTELGKIKSGKVRDLMRPTIYGIGIIGTKYPVSQNGIKLTEYTIWQSMLQRTCCDKWKKRYPTYQECTVSENFKSYEYFYEWCHRQKGFGHCNYELDKDILFKGNKLYGEDTCCFVPSQINQLFSRITNYKRTLPVGVYLTGVNKYYSMTSTYSGIRISPVYNTVEEAFNFFKLNKEENIKYYANLWRDFLDPKVYDALMGWTVEITD